MGKLKHVDKKTPLEDRVASDVNDAMSHEEIAKLTKAVTTYDTVFVADNGQIILGISAEPSYDSLNPKNLYQQSIYKKLEQSKILGKILRSVKEKDLEEKRENLEKIFTNEGLIFLQAKYVNPIVSRVNKDNSERDGVDMLIERIEYVLNHRGRGVAPAIIYVGEEHFGFMRITKPLKHEVSELYKGFSPNQYIGTTTFEQIQQSFFKQIKQEWAQQSFFNQIEEERVAKQQSLLEQRQQESVAKQQSFFK